MAISFGVDKLKQTCYNNILQHLSLAQLDRVPGYEPGGREFESLRGGQFRGNIMDQSEKGNLLEALKKGTVTVSFRKIDTGELRVMPCTLNPVVLEANGVTNKVNVQGTDTEAFPVWALNKDAWRSFRLDTLEG